MSVRVTIETASKAEAELIAQRLPVKANQSWRGFGVIRVGAKATKRPELIEAVSRSFTDHGLRARVAATTEYVLRAAAIRPANGRLRFPSRAPPSPAPG
jgi:hypothetical protein